MTIYSDYDGFARVYSEHWGPHEGGKALPRLKRLFLGDLPPGSSILDLCCGSGHLMQPLLDEGYRVTGLDGSSALLEYARANAPDADLLHADARDFQTPSTFDAVVCIADSLNHMMTLEDLTNVFANAYTALRRGGIFHFDLNREWKYRNRWHTSFAIVEDDVVCAVRCGVDQDDEVASFLATIFERGDTWVRRDVALYQTWYSEPAVAAALEGVGFKDIEMSYSDQDVDIAEKVYLQCRKSDDWQPKRRSGNSHRPP